MVIFPLYPGCTGIRDNMHFFLVLYDSGEGFGTAFMNLLTSHEPSVYLFIYSDARLTKPTIIVAVIVLRAYHV